MRIGVPKEIKVHEYRVGLAPEGVRTLCAEGNEVWVESGAAQGIGIDDEEYRVAGATIAASASEVFEAAELIVKVKEPLTTERTRLRRGQTLFTYLHLAPDPYQAHDLINAGVTAIAYETVTSPEGGFPLLAPMSVIAGRMSVQVTARFLEKPQGGRGVLLGGAAGVAPARVLILGAGSVGQSAARIAIGMGAEVIVFNRVEQGLTSLECELGPRLRTILAGPERIAAELPGADAVIGAAYVAGAAAPKLITRAMLKTMKPGAVLVDVSIDQGGCFETSRPTTHADPVFTVDGIVHYCVANMPGAVPRTSTYALNSATLPFVRKLAALGAIPALRADAHLRNGLNVHAGKITQREVAAALGYAYCDPLNALT
ncbi:MAG: alanine dehydrogenase [Burkholderiales bacterium]